jgi:hypothetical protein
MCVPGFQQGAQGQALSRLSRILGANNKNYVLELAGWDCGTNTPTSTPTNCAGSLKKRAVSIAQSVTQGTDTNSEWRLRKAYTLRTGDFFLNVTDSGQKGLMLYLGDVDAGS